MLRLAAADDQVAARDGPGDQEGARFDAVGDDGVVGAGQTFDALDADGGSAGALDSRAHPDEQRRQVAHFRLARRVVEHGFPARQHGRHQQVLGARHRDPVEMNRPAAKAVRRGGFDVSVGLLDPRAQLLQALDVQVDRAGADGAATRQRHSGAARARQERAQHQTRRAHGLHQVVGGFGRGERLRPDAHHAGFAVFDRRPGVLQQPLHGADVAHARDAAKRDRLRGEQTSGQRRQGGILRAASRDFTLQRRAAANQKLFHISIIRRISPSARATRARRPRANAFRRSPSRCPGVP